MLKKLLTVLTFFVFNLTFAQYAVNQNTTNSFNFEHNELAKASAINFSDYYINDSNYLNNEVSNLNNPALLEWPQYAYIDSIITKTKMV